MFNVLVIVKLLFLMVNFKHLITENNSHRVSRKMSACTPQ